MALKVAADEDPNLILTELTREEAIRSSIRVASIDAINDNEPVIITACLGKPCEGSKDGHGCDLCERIICYPNGLVERRLTRN